ncbi:DNA-binding transcriptional regulator [Novosphingobium sp. CCH12-A3]|uniref:helix-turn-helix domain-containing protein n=1 Tax=Novosphingobium sp. CCH12-A3 TaxID=1768752 RepID=UPI000AC9E33D|nr:hypothetical protein [Novosphingobium sp. CCH12-A3]
MAFNPDFGKTGFARHLFRLRFRDLKLSQRAFAERFGLSYSVVRDAEQGAKPTRALRVIVAAIGANPAFMQVAAGLVSWRRFYRPAHSRGACKGAGKPESGSVETRGLIGSN